MSINSISGYNYSSAFMYVQTIPEYLIKQLIELGINPKTVDSAAEAMNLIEQAKNPANGQPDAIETEEETNEKNTDLSNSSLYFKAKALAKRLGINPTEQASLDNILAAIQEAIDEILDKAQKTGDEDLLDFAKACQFELDLIISEKNGSDTSSAQLFNYMEMLAEQNKAQMMLPKNKLNFN